MVERFVYTEDVGSSSLSSPTIIFLKSWESFDRPFAVRPPNCWAQPASLVSGTHRSGSLANSDQAEMKKAAISGPTMKPFSPNSAIPPTVEISTT